MAKRRSELAVSVNVIARFSGLKQSRKYRDALLGAIENINSLFVADEPDAVISCRISDSLNKKSDV